MRGISMPSTSHRRICFAIALAMLVWTPAFAQAPRKEGQQADALEKLARQEFGELSAAERTFVRGAVSRNLLWVGPNDNPDDPANDPAKTEKWSPDRNIRAGVFAWLVADPEAAPFLHPSGPGIAGAKIVGKLDLSYADVTRPLTLIRCAIPDGIDFSNASIAGIELRSSVTGPITRRLRARQRRPRAALRPLRGAQHFSRDYRWRSRLQRRRLHRQWRRRHHLGAGIVDRRRCQLRAELHHRWDAVLSPRADRPFAQLQSRALRRQRRDRPRRSARDGSRDRFTGSTLRVTPQTRLDLENAAVAALFDNRASWPAPGNLDIDGFTYSEFGDDSPADSWRAARMARTRNRRDIVRSPTRNSRRRSSRAAGLRARPKF